MKLVEFKYTKDNNEVSERAVIEVTVPNKFFEGWDITNLNYLDAALFINEMAVLKRSHFEQIADLLNKFDLKHSYRRFKPENMTNTKIEYV
jgi:hypothetical protein